MSFILDPVGINDVTFRAMDVVLIAGGIISALGGIFGVRFAIGLLKQRVQQLETTIEAQQKRIDSIDNAQDILEKDIKDKLNDVLVKIAEFKTEVIKLISGK